jgi:ubiquinone/menaquinone biosynthesis C-methylase UbiE
VVGVVAADVTDATTGPPGRERSHGLADVRATYAEQADRFDRLQWLNRRLTGGFRRRLFGRAEGRVLDVACGTGLNVDFLPADTAYVGVDLSPEMVANARRRYGRLDRVEGFCEADAQTLPFDDGAFDTVVSALSTCTFPEPVAALDEMARVCRPGGRVLLFEHGRSAVGPVARVQAWRADAHYENHSCRWDQEPLALVDAAAGLSVVDASTALLGVLTAVEAEPARG